MTDWLILIAAGFLGGLLNAVAGGGSFFTLPALMLVGVPPMMANATGTAVLLPGYVASAWRFRSDIRWPHTLGGTRSVALILAGGCLGAILLLVSGNDAFESLIPWLILFATGWFALGPRLIARRQHALPRLASGALLFGACVYGGFFNGGLGIVLLAVFGFMGMTEMAIMNGLKNIASALLTLIAVLVYASGNAIEWRWTGIMMGAAIAGGYLGAAWSYRLPQKALRLFIVASGVVMAAAFFARPAM